MTLRTPSFQMPCAAVIIAGLLICSTASAEGWGLPNLNPFAKKSKAPTSARVSDGGSDFSILPKWGSSTPKKRSKGPSTWSRMTGALNPWGGSKAEAPDPSPTGSFNPFATASSKKQSTESSSFLPSWLSPAEEEDKGAQSVNDFLKQDKLDYP